MTNKSISFLFTIMAVSPSAFAHKGHIEHELFGWMHSHVGWEHLLVLALAGLLALVAPKR